jgi:hypothetical protein
MVVLNQELGAATDEAGLSDLSGVSGRTVKIQDIATLMTSEKGRFRSR